LNVGAIVSLAPDLSAFTKLLAVDESTVKKVLASWGPGKYDAELNLDGKAFRPDGKPAAVLLPPAFGTRLVPVQVRIGSERDNLAPQSGHVSNFPRRLQR
jgi:hypothetical protein